MKRLILLTFILLQFSLIGSCQSRIRPLGANIVSSGNSLTRGYPDGAPWDYVTRLSSLADVTVTNVGHDSAMTNQLASYAVTELYPLRDRSRRNIAIINEVGNDIYFNGDEEGAVERFILWHNDIRSKGWEVLVVNLAHRGNLDGGVTPFGDTEEQYQAKLATAREALTSWAKANNVPIVELMNDPRLADCTDERYFTDRVHLTHEGYLAMAEDVYAGLQAMSPKGCLRCVR